MLKQTSRTVLAMCVLCLVATAAIAGPQARIKGTVVDSEGNALPDAVITITCPESPSFERIIKPDEKGHFKALILDATRKYIFHVKAEGFILHEEEFKVPVGTMDNDFPFTLKTLKEQSVLTQLDLKEQPGYKQLGEGRELFDAGKTAEAVAKYEEAVALVPDLLPGWMALIEVANTGDDSAYQLELAEKCLEIDDEALNCLAVAANAAKALGQMEKSEGYLLLYQELNPNDPTTMYNTAVEFLNKLDDEKARPLLEQCLEADADFGQCIFQLGMILLRSGDMEGAKKHLEHYLAVDPEGSEAATARDVLKYL